MYLSKEQILAASGRRFADCEVPELGGKVRLVTPSARRILQFRELQKRAEKGESVETETFTLLLASSLCDAKGAPLCDEDGARAILDQIAVQTASKLVTAITELIGEDEKKPEGTEPRPSEASPSAS